ncbi:MAG TPA: hypothetical protein VMZ53_30925 [Kofleriaceae bacterium]|nr:hypothetical protein [Kofleriaceae bacterium]
MRRRKPLLLLLASTAVATLLAVAVHSSSVNADLENKIFTSRAHRLRMVVPRGWRETDQPSYPGLLLWMLRSQPEGKMVLTAEPFTRQVYCSWPIECRSSPDSLQSKFACAMRRKLEDQRLHVGPVQAGPKENEQAGVPSVWFELDDGHDFLRQAVAVREDRLISLVLSARSAEARNAHVRYFEQALRTLRPLTPAELGEPLPSPQQVVTQLIDDAGIAPTTDALAVTTDAAVAATTFESAPVQKAIDPVGPCSSTK